MTEKEKYLPEIRTALGPRSLLESIAEEASEVAQAALKMVRAKGLSGNYTPVTEESAREKLFEELLDLLAVLDVANIFDIQNLLNEEAEYWKWKRWHDRLYGVEQ